MKLLNQVALVALLCSTGLFAQAQIINTFPYKENFETFTLCGTDCGDPCPLTGGWVNFIGDGMDWTVNEGLTPSLNTGPDFDHNPGTSTGNYLYTETSNGCGGLTAALLTPPLNLSGMTNFSFDFWFHMYGNMVPTLHIDISANGGLFVDDVVPAIAQNVNQWHKKTVNLDAYAGDTIVIRLRAVTGSGNTDMAVDDFSFYTMKNNDAGISAVVAPVSPFLPGAKDVTVTLNNFGLNPLTSATVNWSVNGAVQTPYSWTGSLTSTQTANVTIGNYNFSAGTAALKVWTSNPNNTTDPEPTNDTIRTSPCTGLNGTYTVGGVSPNFSNVPAAITALFDCGISGPVVFNIAAGSAPHTGQITFTAVPGASAVNTITFNGNGTEIIAAPNTDDRYIVRLNGAKHFILDNLKLTGVDTTFGWGVLLTNKADSNTVRNCTIDLSAVKVVLPNNSAGIVATATALSVSSGGNNTSRLIAQNNTIIGGYQGIRLMGAQSTKSFNNLISNNIIRDFYSYGIYLADNDNTILSGNDISRGNRVNVGTFNGIHLDVRNVRTLIEKNKIHNTHGSATVLTGAVNGISMASCDAVLGAENKIINNVIYDIASNGTVYGIINNGSDGAFFYHNTISLDHPTSSNGITRGFYQTAVASNIRFRNNIISVTRSGAGTKHCIYFATPTSGISSNYNTFFVDTTTSNLGYYTADVKTLDRWKLVNGGIYDNASVYANPLFVDLTNNLIPTNAVVNNIGDSLGVATDVTGAARNLSDPDPGAYEFNPPTADVSISWVSPLSPTVAGNKTIIVKISNSIASVQTITDLRLVYTDGGTPVTENFDSLSIAPGANLDISFTTPYNLNQHTEIFAYISLVNGVPDAFQSNDTVSQVLCPSLSGTYTINKTLTTGGTNFNSFTDAIDALSFCGIIAPVTINVAAGTGPYTEQLTIPAISGTSSINRITINGNNNTLQFSPTASNRHIIKLNGAKYFTFDSLRIATTSATYGWGVHLLSAADRNTFTNCTIDLATVSNNTNTTDFVGIVATNSSTQVSQNANNANYLTVSNCTIIGGGYGIRLNGNVNAKARGNNITGNTIRDFYSYGVYLTHADSCHITENNISRATRVNTGPFYGVYLTTGVENTFIERNSIHNTHDAASPRTEIAYAIYSSSADAQLGKANIIANNIIYNINGNGAIYGIYNLGSDYAKYYHNSISLDDTTAATIDEAIAFYQNTVASGVEFKNNIITVKRTGSGPKHCLYFGSTSSSIQSNNNILFMNAGGVNNHIGHYGVNDYTTLANWQTNANGGIYDRNSTSADPQFTDPYNGNFAPLNYGINNLGTSVGVATDYNLNPRNLTFPDPGAIEFTPAGLDAAIAWVSPVTPISSGLHTIVVNVSNTQTTTITSLVLSYTDGVIVRTQRFGGLSLTGGTNQNFSFTTQYNVGGFSSLYAYIDSVNIDKDANRLNDTTTTQVLCATMSGNFTINKGAVGSATNFTSFADAAARLANCGISGPVTIEVVQGSGPYNEQVSIPFIFGSSAVNTVLIDGNHETLTFSPTTDDRYLVRLDGTKHLTIRDLQITGTSPTFGYGIHFINAADSNAITGCKINIESVTNTVSDNSAGILFSGSTTTTITTGNNGNYNQITNNEVIGGYSGVRVIGQQGAPVLGNNFIDNIVRDFFTYGFYFTNVESSQITGNDITRATRQLVGTFYGINLSSANQSIIIERNRIHNTHDNASSLTGASYVINFASCNAAVGKENKVINNLIYNINSNGTIYAIFNSASDGAHYYHNSISIDHQTTSGGTTRGFYQTSPASNVDFRNNIVSITRSGTGTKHCIYLAEPTSRVTADYNLYFIDTVSFHVGSYNSTDYRTLAEWQTADSSAYDQHSTFENPVFGSVANGNLMPLNSLINDRGIGVGVTTDFTLAARDSATPDVGAYEFTPVLLDATVVSLLQPEQNACGSSAVDVIAVVTNFGVSTISNVFVTAQLTGSATGIFTGNTGTLTNSQSDTLNLGSVNLPAGGTFTATIYTALANDEIPTNDTLVVTRTITPPTPAPTLLAYQDSVCKNTTQSLGVVTSPNLSYFWYDTISGGTALKEGAQFTTPALAQNTTYYVEASSDIRHSVGPEDDSIGTASNFIPVGDRGLLFDVITTLTLDSVSVYPNDTGTVYIELTDVSNTVIYNITSAHVSASGTRVQIPVGFILTPGSYRIDANGSTTGGLIYNSIGATYPYKINNVISITGNTFNPDHYYYFYDWKITEKGCPSPRVAVPIVVNLTDTAASAAFNFTTNGLNVTFIPGDANPNNSYAWDFGDSVTANIGSITHQYLTDGAYNVCLTTSNSCSQDTECKQVTACMATNALFNATTSGLTASFSFNGLGIPVNHYWDFSDGGTSLNATPSHTFAGDGTFNVRLVVENLCGDFDTTIQSVTVCQPVVADFTAAPVTAGGLDYTFTNTTAGAAVSYAWNFGNSTTSTDTNATHTYAAHGSYDITLIVANVCGDADTTVESITTCATASAAFTATVQTGGNVTTANASTGSELTYDWSFGDGGTSTDAAPAHTYLTTGTYTITLTITDACGQTNTATQSVDISVGIGQVHADFDVTVLPNPNNGKFVVRYTLPNASDVSIRLFNFIGETVYLQSKTLQHGTHTQQLELNHLAKGIYFMEVKTEKGMGVKKVAVE